MQEYPNSAQNRAENPKNKKLITIILAGAAALLLVSAMLILYFTVINPREGGGTYAAKNVKLEIIVPNEAIYTFINSTDDFKEVKKPTLYDYLNYLKANEALEIDISGGGFVNGFYGYTPDVSENFYMIFINGKKSNYGVKSVNLKDGDKYSFVPMPVSAMNQNDIPAFLTDSAYWLPSIGKKDVKLVFIYGNSRNVFSITTEKTLISELFEEYNDSNNMKVNFIIDEYGGYITSVEGIENAGNFWQVYSAFSDVWSIDYKSAEIFNIGGTNNDWMTGEPTLPGYLYDGLVIFIRLNPSGF